MGIVFGKFCDKVEEPQHNHILCEKCDSCIICNEGHICLRDDFVMVNNDEVEITIDENIPLEEIIDEEDVLDSSKNWALLVGINYRGQEGELNGCINDVMNMKDVLINKFNIDEDKIIVLTDDENDLQPTRYNIINELNNMVLRAKKGELKQLWFHYSGHGSWMWDDSDDELDGKDEVIVPVDFETRGFITDDELNEYLVNEMPIDTKTLIFMDCCHSGTMLDLSCHFKYKKETPHLSSWILENNDEQPYGEFIMISGCMDNQTSADALINNKYQGAMTSALLETLKGVKKWEFITFMDLLSSMVEKTEEYNQRPQLTSSNMYDLNKLKLKIDWF